MQYYQWGEGRKLVGRRGLNYYAYIFMTIKMKIVNKVPIFESFEITH